jgi:hypothetical protein
MENGFSFDIETLWDHLLSRQSDLIRATYQSLSPAEQHNVLAHLQRMVSEPGWHPEQVASAQTALEALGRSD